MPNTIGYHFVKSAYGLWLPGDDRGHWSEAYDDQIGYHEPHTLHAGDPVRHRMAAERMKHPAVRFDEAMMRAIEHAIEKCAADSAWEIVAGSIEPTHTHLLITYSGLDIHRTTKWLSQCMTKAVHRETSHTGPVWCEGSWCSFLFEDSYWLNTIRYIERHNERRGVGPRPYRLISAL